MSSIRKCIEKQINVITQGVLKDAKDVREKINKVNKKKEFSNSARKSMKLGLRLLQYCKIVSLEATLSQLPELVRISIIMSITH